MPSSREIEIFLAVYRALSFTKAAEKLFISQQSCSRYIRSLEDKVGFCLFERNTRNVTPTEEGEMLFQTLIEASHNYNTVVQYGRVRAGIQTINVRVGVMHGINLVLIAGQYMEFLRKNPQASVNWIFSNPDQLKAMLRDNAIDLAITHMKQDDSDEEMARNLDYQSCRLCSTRVYLKYAPNHPLAATARVPNDFSGAVFSALHHDNTDSSADVFRAKRRLEYYGLKGNSIRLFDSIEEADASIQLGETVGIISEHTMSAQFAGLCSMYLGEGDPLILLWKRNSNNNLLHLFVDGLTKTVPDPDALDNGRKVNE